VSAATGCCPFPFLSLSAGTVDSAANTATVGTAALGSHPPPPPLHLHLGAIGVRTFCEVDRPPPDVCAHEETGNTEGKTPMDILAHDLGMSRAAGRQAGMCACVIENTFV
jgi:hypothetical protein